MGKIKFSGKASEYTVAVAANLGGAIVINDSVFARDYSRVITDPATILVFSDADFKADEFLPSNKNSLELDSTLPFKKKFSIIETASEYRLVEFGKHIVVDFGVASSINLSIFGYDERVDSIIMDTQAFSDDLGYSYGIYDKCFNLKITGTMDKDRLKNLLYGCACAVFCVFKRHIKVSLNVDSKLIFSKEYDCDIARGV